MLCGLKELLDEADRVLQIGGDQLLSYDTTFQLGDFYVSPLIFRHTIFKERPCIPVMFLLHERKFTEVHKEMFKECSKHMQSLRKIKIPLVMDREPALIKAVQSELPNIALVLCWNHIFRDIWRWLQQHGAPSTDITIYKDDVQRLFHCCSNKEYSDELEKSKMKWDDEFTKYDLNEIHPHVPLYVGRWVLEDVHIYNPYSGITNNQSESLNFVLKELQGWKEVQVDNAVLAFYQMQAFYSNEIKRGLAGIGEYHVLSQYTSIVLAEKDVELIPTCSPKDIVQRLKGKVLFENSTVTPVMTASMATVQETEEKVNACSTKGTAQYRAKMCIEGGCVSFDAKLSVFLVKGTSGVARVVTVFPSETCSCPSKHDCYHILAVKMSIGIPPVQKRSINLSQLRKNTRSTGDKRSGRKRPRRNDVEG